MFWAANISTPNYLESWLWLNNYYYYSFCDRNFFLTFGFRLNSIVDLCCSFYAMISRKFIFKFLTINDYTHLLPDHRWERLWNRCSSPRERLQRQWVHWAIWAHSSRPTQLLSSFQPSAFGWNSLVLLSRSRSLSLLVFSKKKFENKWGGSIVFGNQFVFFHNLITIKVVKITHEVIRVCFTKNTRSWLPTTS